MHIEHTDSRVSVQIAPADVASWDNCHRQLAYEQVWRVQVASPDALEVFGGCIEQSVYHFLLETAIGGRVTDPIEQFVKIWREALSERPPQFRARENAQSFERAGTKLMRLLGGAWKRSGLAIARYRDGTPLIRLPASLEWDLKFDRTPQLALELIGTIGVIVEGRDLGRALLEVTTVRSPHSHRFVRRTDILTGYQLLFNEEGRREFWDKEVNAVGFWDFIKTEADASIADPLFAPARQADEITEFCNKVDWMAEDVAQGRFTRTSRWEWNTPCARCPYARHCMDEDTTGLLFPSQPLIAA